MDLDGHELQQDFATLAAQRAFERASARLAPEITSSRPAAQTSPRCWAFDEKWSKTLTGQPISGLRLQRIESESGLHAYFPRQRRQVAGFGEPRGPSVLAQ
jgi:hypothetical protein